MGEKEVCPAASERWPAVGEPEVWFAVSERLGEPEVWPAANEHGLAVQRYGLLGVSISWLWLSCFCRIGSTFANLALIPIVLV